ncbi:uncharacterized protein A4U43_C04F34540 [Asparagus officinalis]|uniref:C2H2-type domain-containing protein n=1 Tax=Asparagus officinalis TaxID=4686 RepID=A0A5P1F5T7_ASPOF|nr:uncharacterized protein A4U43_C04F34540 [Asparagus officinalis]
MVSNARGIPTLEEVVSGVITFLQGGGEEPSCDERIQKIQTIKLMEGIYICGAPHCLKSFLRRSDLEAHINEAHADLIRPNIEKEEANDNNALNTAKPSSTDAQKQSQQPEVSTARAPPKPSAFSPSANSQDQDREERARRHQSRDPSPRPQLQPNPPQFQNQQQTQTSDFPAENQPQNWFPQPPTLPPFQQNPDQFPMNYPLPYPVQFPTDGSQPLYNVPQDSNQGSVLGVQPSPSAIGGFPNNLSQQWAMGFMSVPLQPLHMNNPQFLQGEGMTINPQIQGKESDQQPPPPLPLTPPPALAHQQQQQINRNRDFPPGFG